MSALKDPFAGKPIIALDFDGVLHDYHGWNGGRLGGSLPMAVFAVEIFIDRSFRVVVFSTREEEQIRKWLKDNGFPPLEICSEKPPAVVIVDDRAITFNAWSPGFIENVCAFRAHWESERKI